jgi:hypothetical protein
MEPSKKIAYCHFRFLVFKSVVYLQLQIINQDRDFRNLNTFPESRRNRNLLQKNKNVLLKNYFEK